MRRPKQARASAPGKTVTLSKQVPVVGETDVLIAGGGIAGCTAAVTAARHGARVVLVERYGTLGGVTPRRVNVEAMRSLLAGKYQVPMGA